MRWKPLTNDAGLGGTVLDDEGEAVASAEIQLYREHTRVRVTTTDADGHFTFAGLTPGRFWIRARRAGYFDEEQMRLEVWSGWQVEYQPLKAEKCAPGKCDTSLKTISVFPGCS